MKSGFVETSLEELAVIALDELKIAKGTVLIVVMHTRQMKDVTELFNSLLKSTYRGQYSVSLGKVHLPEFGTILMITENQLFSDRERGLKLTAWFSTRLLLNSEEIRLDQRVF